jgi:hypothetical protein
MYEIIYSIKKPTPKRPLSPGEKATLKEYVLVFLYVFFVRVYTLSLSQGFQG